jgi:transcriptional regulator with XRE-family HTH domain
MTLGQRIRELRQIHTWTQAQLAAKVGGKCSAKVIADYEHGRSEPGPKRARDLADAFGLPGGRAELYEGVE